MAIVHLEADYLEVELGSELLDLGKDFGVDVGDGTLGVDSWVAGNKLVVSLRVCQNIPTVQRPKPISREGVFGCIIQRGVRLRIRHFEFT